MGGRSSGRTRWRRRYARIEDRLSRLRGCAAALARLNYGHRLGEIQTPTLVICGSEDHGAPPENTRQMHAMIKGSRFLEIEQAGHISNIEKPEIFNTAVAKLFDDVERGVASRAAE